MYTNKAKPNDTQAWFRQLLCHLAIKWSGLLHSSPASMDQCYDLIVLAQTGHKCQHSLVWNTMSSSIQILIQKCYGIWRHTIYTFVIA